MLLSSPLDEGNLSEPQAREQICEVGRRLWERQLVEGNAGNIAYRLDANRILATPTLISKGFMKPEDLVVLDNEGNQLEGRREKTSEILMHLHVMRHRPDVRCSIHCHATHGTALSMTRRGALPTGVLPEAELFLGTVPIVPYATTGTPQMGEALDPYLATTDAFILANHGILALGPGIVGAFWKVEILEAYCRLLILSQSLGEPIALSAEQLAALAPVRAKLQRALGGK